MPDVMRSMRKVLIINRGEIALRAIRACRDLGLSCGIVYTASDAKSLPVRLADERFLLSQPNEVKAYLDQEEILRIAQENHFDTVYPGYGFLAENSAFSGSCAAAGIIFVGPSASVLKFLGDKVEAKRVALSLEIPMIPGSHHSLSQIDEALRVAQEIGYPLLIKAAHGGGGRGIKLAHSERELREQFAAAKSESMLAFGSAAVYLEKYFDQVQHIEFQILADYSGTVLSLGERECSVQRRHQKLIEEAPSASLTPPERRHYGELAKALINAVGLVGVATVEFLRTPEGKLYFIEVNPRIQVEHGVTELTTGLDLVKWQLRIARHERLPMAQAEIQIQGHAIEVRINAEDPSQNFMPTAGVIDAYLPPGGPGIRVDSALYSGISISGQFDTLLAKILSLGQDRSESLMRLRRALQEFVLQGVQTNLPLQRSILAEAKFVSNQLSTRYLETTDLGGAARTQIPASLPLVAPHPSQAADTARMAVAIYRAVQTALEVSAASAWQSASRQDGLTEDN